MTSTAVKNASTDTQVKDMQAKISAYLARKSGVSLFELSRDIAGFSGEDVWRTENNVVIWCSMSAAAITAMLELIRLRSIEPTASNVLVYAFDGAVLDMPIAKSVTRKYARPHWLPTVFAGNREAA